MAETTASRPRVSGDREREILDATITVLLDVGYDKLTFDLVAHEAHASKATLYRKWSGKSALVMDAVRNSKDCSHHMRETPNTGDLVCDLVQFSENPNGKPAIVTAILGALAPALHRDNALRAAFTATFFRPRIEQFRQILRNAQARGELSAGVDIDLVADVVPAMAIHHSLLDGTPPTTEYLTRVIAEVLLPALGATAQTTTHEERRG